MIRGPWSLLVAMVACLPLACVLVAGEAIAQDDVDMTFSPDETAGGRRGRWRRRAHLRGGGHPEGAAGGGRGGQTGRARPHPA
ncbi:MAG: hypothetical protein R3F43_08740 [bacterium]